MPSRGIVPVADAELGGWFSHLASKINAHASALAITPQDIASLQADAAMVDWILKTLPSIRASAQQLTAYKDNLFDGQAGPASQAVPDSPTFLKPPPAVPDGVVPRARALVQRIKKSPGYTDAIGKDLGLVAPDAAADVAPKPTYRASVLPSSGVRLDWMKRGHNGVVIQCKRIGDADWVTLGLDNFSPYVDERPPVTAGANETRQYRMRYVDKDVEVGEWSDIVSVVTTA